MLGRRSSPLPLEFKMIRIKKALRRLMDSAQLYIDLANSALSGTACANPGIAPILHADVEERIKTCLLVNADILATCF